MAMPRLTIGLLMWVVRTADGSPSPRPEVVFLPGCMVDCMVHPMDAGGKHMNHECGELTIRTSWRGLEEVGRVDPHGNVR